MSTEYHKIQSVYLRDPATKNKTFLEGQWSEPEFGYLANNQWCWTEKVDGTNIRIDVHNGAIQFGGRTDAAQIPVPLSARLKELFTPAKLGEVFTLDENFNMTIYGEGFGANIQKNGDQYKPDGVDFILFDVYIGGLWLERANVEDIAKSLGCSVVPIVGYGTLLEAIEAVRHGGFDSTVAAQKRTAEGLVMRPVVELLTRRGERVITKVKVRDFPNR